MAFLPLLRGSCISLEDAALTDDDNILHRLDDPRKLEKFWAHLTTHQAWIKALVAYYYWTKHCRVADEANWLFGSYDVCVPVYANGPSRDRVLVRISLPHKEELRSEVARYFRIHENCPTVPSPTLYGFGFPDGQTTILRDTAFSNPVSYYADYPLVARIPRRMAICRAATGDMVIGSVESGRMLSDTWATHLLEDKARRQTLFSDLAKIMLSLSCFPMPRIGSLALNNTGHLGLINRTLTLRHSTYRSVEPYVLDLLQCYDNRICYQPNASHNEKNGEEQFTALTMVRRLLHQFVSRQYRNGPFGLNLTDLHLNDREHGEHPQTFENILAEFIDAFEEVEYQERVR
ncbi:hypothetical protein BO70DRAFT_387397 [Aspergillus heteromorphus CBS 117.55]|uniref:Uncharacterized protein n=1 Tax=Aspergillus heteromorphus CBS 117.55 TaxID=1448321 RepID=A0A317W7J0_9EURO|nr:uncharacterized protein BO70DRAFT_387397 [Aspergillus heteromorphus CBS 117.55]PWY81845.1 hypothetical protein BO70DRAFT_387397 [Aspergillus heteromorphus CBS 117.55]